MWLFLKRDLVVYYYWLLVCYFVEEWRNYRYFLLCGEVVDNFDILYVIVIVLCIILMDEYVDLWCYFRVNMVWNNVYFFYLKYKIIWERIKKRWVYVFM